jgi:hypothetical protein
LIKDLPRKIAAAAKRGQDHVRVYGWVDYADVAGNHPDKVDRLWEKTHGSSTGEVTRPLRANELAGKAKIICEWCEQNDLECFLEAEKIPMNDFEYHFCVQPKRTK